MNKLAKRIENEINRRAQNAIAWDYVRTHSDGDRVVLTGRLIGATYDDPDGDVEVPPDEVIDDAAIHAALRALGAKSYVVTPSLIRDHYYPGDLGQIIYDVYVTIPK